MNEKDGIMMIMIKCYLPRGEEVIMFSAFALFSLLPLDLARFHLTATAVPSANGPVLLCMPLLSPCGPKRLSMTMYRLSEPGPGRGNPLPSSANCHALE